MPFQTKTLGMRGGCRHGGNEASRWLWNGADCLRLPPNPPAPIPGRARSPPSALPRWCEVGPKTAASASCAETPPAPNRPPGVPPRKASSSKVGSAVRRRPASALSIPKDAKARKLRAMRAATGESWDTSANYLVSLCGISDIGTIKNDKPLYAAVNMKNRPKSYVYGLIGSRNIFW